MGFRGAWPWSDRQYADVSDRRGPDTNQHSVGLFSRFGGHKHETRLFGFVTSGRRDLNPRPLEPHSSVLPS